jgi:nitrogen fixation protein FixH
MDPMKTPSTRTGMRTAPASGRPLTGRQVLWMFIAFFGVMFAVNGFMAYAAIKTFRGADTESVYAASRAFPGEIAAAQRQAALDWSVDLHADRTADGAAAIVVSPFDAQGKPVTGLTLRARFEHPSDRYRDKAVDLVEARAGTYQASAEGVAGGAWDVTIEAARDGERVYRSRNRIMLP